MSSSSRALVIVSLNVEGGSWEAEDLQELKERLESREFTAASKMSAGAKGDSSSVKVLSAQMGGAELGFPRNPCTCWVGGQV